MGLDLSKNGPKPDGLSEARYAFRAGHGDDFADKKKSAPPEPS